MVIMDMRRSQKKSLSHSGVWGRNPQDFIMQAQSKEVFHLVAIKIIVI
jgi:hypothetical protein